MGKDKAFLDFRGKPFIWHAVSSLAPLVDHTKIVIGEKSDLEFRASLRDFSNLEFLNDSRDLSSPLGGLLTAFEKERSHQLITLGCDTPLVKPEVLSLIFESSIAGESVIPRWENRQLEPLVALYNVFDGMQGCLRAISAGKKRCVDMISFLPRVRFLPVESIRRVDPKLVSLWNVNSFEEFERIKRETDPTERK